MSTVIILLEDEELPRELYKAALEAEGYQVVCAENSRNLVQLYQQWKPSLIITDLIMPDYEGMEGIFNIIKIADIPIIAMSINPHYLQMAEDFVSAVLAKPFSMSELTDKVNTLLKN
jgi:DNA-binding response OmpR family regulator